MRWHVTAPNQLRLYRRDDNRFQVIRAGQAAAVLTGHGYVLMNQRVLETLRGAGISLVDRPAVIYDRATETESDAYQEVQIDGVVTPETVNALAEDEHLWLYGDEHLFVSEKVRSILCDAFPDLALSKGFSNFAG